jgi:hypothetical protein
MAERESVYPWQDREKEHWREDSETEPFGVSTARLGTEEVGKAWRSTKEEEIKMPAAPPSMRRRAGWPLMVASSFRRLERQKGSEREETGSGSE